MLKIWCENCWGEGSINSGGKDCPNCQGKGYVELEPDGEVEIVEFCREINGVMEPTSELTIDYEGEMTTFKTVDEGLAWAKRHNFKVAKIYDLKTRGNPIVIEELFKESKSE